MEKKRDSFFLPQKKRKIEENRAHDNSESITKNKEVKSNIKRASKDENSEPGNDEIKKPFDKKTYRLKKYSKKYKLEQWEQLRKKKLIRNYQKEMKNETLIGSFKSKPFDQDITDSNIEGRYVRHPDLINSDAKAIQKNDPFKRAKDQFSKVKQAKLEKQQQMEKNKEERQQKLQEYKKKKQERFKKLSKKTKKGQPVMTGRLELLLEKIQNSK